MAVISSVILSVFGWLLRDSLPSIPQLIQRWRLRRWRDVPAKSDPVPHARQLLGRDRDIRDLGDPIRERTYRVIGVVGEPGVGKSALAAELVAGADRNVFGRPFWLNCRPAPTVGEAIFRLARYFNQQLDVDELAGLRDDQRIDRLIVAMDRSPCLIVLDNLEALFDRERQPRGTFRDEGWAELLTRFALGNHASVVVLTSRQRPACLSEGRGEYHASNLLELASSAARELLRKDEIDGTDAVLDQVTDAVGRNPLRLGQLATIARRLELDAEGLLNHPDLLTREIGELLTKQRESVAGTDADVLLSAVAVYRRPVPSQALRFVLGAGGKRAGRWRTSRAIKNFALTGFSSICPPTACTRCILSSSASS